MSKKRSVDIIRDANTESWQTRKEQEKNKKGCEISNERSIYRNIRKDTIQMKKKKRKKVWNKHTTI